MLAQTHRRRCLAHLRKFINEHTKEKEKEKKCLRLNNNKKEPLRLIQIPLTFFSVHSAMP